MSINVAVVTGSRADYGLLSPLLKVLVADDFFNTYLLVTGMHLDGKYGDTRGKIIEDGFEITCEIELTQEGDKPDDICKAVAIGLQGFSEHFKSHDYNVLIVLGDRYELWSACMAAVIHRIPIAHIHGGEITAGALDELIRHSITKMASIHFPSLDIYAGRIIQMGENPFLVFTVGALGIDNIMNVEKMPINELSGYIGADFENESIALMTYHPVTTDDYTDAENQVMQVLEALDETRLKTVVTMPNSDTGGDIIYRTILEFINIRPDKFILKKNLGQRAYISAMSRAALMIGNSSSGIIEAASFRLPVVNVGDRQAGRYKTRNIIDCNCTKEDIRRAISLALSTGFKESLSKLESPYGSGDTAKRIVNTLKSINFKNKNGLLKKVFHTVPD